MNVLNKTSLDAVAELVSQSTPETNRRLVYIRANTEAAISDIGTGLYLLSFTLGRAWRNAYWGFAQDRVRQTPIGPLTFIEIQSPEGRRSDRYEIVLRPAEAPVAGSRPR